MEEHLLPSLVRVESQVAKDVPELVDRFRTLRGNSPHRSFLTAAKGMLAEALSAKEKFLEQGLAESLLDELGATVSQFEAATEESHKGRRSHVGAGADLKAVTDEILDRVSLLDGLVRYRFGDDSELMAAWVSARNVVGPFRSRGGTPRSTGEETPPSGGVAPAA